MGVNIFVIIVTYNGSQWYQRCFDSLRSSSIPLQVVIVDNASKDLTVQFIKENYPEFILLESDRNFGFGKANNLGIHYALEHDADYVFLLNQDAWLTSSDTIEQLIQIHNTNQQYGILSPMHITAEETGIEKLLLNRLDDFRVTDARLFEDLYFGRLQKVYGTQYVNAASWLISRKVLDMVGGFDPLFFHYGEDDNYLNRVFYHGFKVGICPIARIVHDTDRPRKLYDEREDEILWLIEYSNINASIDLHRELRSYFFRTTTSLLKLRKNRARDCWTRFMFLKQNRKAIEKSRTENKKTGRTWVNKIKNK